MKDIDKNIRSIVKKYLQDNLSKFGYIVGNRTVNGTISINLNTFTIMGQPDIIRLAYKNGYMHYVDNRSGTHTIILDDRNKIGRLEDPEFGGKISAFVKSMHRAKLNERRILYEQQLLTVNDEIDLIDNPPD